MPKIFTKQNANICITCITHIHILTHTPYYNAKLAITTHFYSPKVGLYKSCLTVHAKVKGIQNKLSKPFCSSTRCTHHVCVSKVT